MLGALAETNGTAVLVPAHGPHWLPALTMAAGPPSGRHSRACLDRNTHLSLLTSVAAFAGLDPTERDRLERAGTVSEPRDGTTVFDQGDPGNAIYAIVGGDGHVRIGTINRRSKSRMVEIFRVGDTFGEIGVIDSGVRSAAAVAEGRVRLLRIPAPIFLQALARNPSLGEALCRSLAQRLRRTFSLFQDASFKRWSKRLARQVLYLADREGRRTRCTAWQPTAPGRSCGSARATYTQHHHHSECSGVRQGWS